MVLVAKVPISSSYHYPLSSMFSFLITHSSERVVYDRTNFIIHTSVASSTVTLNGDSRQNNVLHAELKTTINDFQERNVL